MSQSAPTGIASLIPREKKRRLWLKVLIGGFVLWIAALVTLVITQITTLVPSVIFVGAFLTPLTFAVWIFEREQYSGANPDGRPTALRPTLLFAAFFGAGILGVTIAALLETLVLRQFPLQMWYPGVAVIEETTKIVLVVFLARGLKYYTLRDGMVLGAFVGFGFAAFESSGYAFNALIKADDSEIMSVVETQIVRGFLTPVGHGLWTGLLAGAVFAAAAKTGKLHMTWGIFGWWVIVVALHFLWDASNGLSVILALMLTDQPWSFADFQNGTLDDPTTMQAHLMSLFAWLNLTLCSIIGIVLANKMWVKGRAVVEGFPYGPHPDSDESRSIGDGQPATGDATGTTGSTVQ